MSDEDEDYTEEQIPEGVCPVPGCGKPEGHPARHRGQGSDKVRPLPPPKASKPRALPRTDATTSDRQRLMDEVERITDDFQGNIIAQLSPWAPTVSGVWITRAEANTRATMTIAAGHPKVMASILKAAEAEAFFALGTFAVAILVAVGVEFRMVQGDGRLAEGFGITEIWEQVEAERNRTMGRVSTHYNVADTPPASSPGGLVSEI
jgi:hypothetical protein